MSLDGSEFSASIFCVSPSHMTASRTNDHVTRPQLRLYIRQHWHTPSLIKPRCLLAPQLLRLLFKLIIPNIYKSLVVYSLVSSTLNNRWITNPDITIRSKKPLKSVDVSIGGEHKQASWDRTDAQSLRANFNPPLWAIMLSRHRGTRQAWDWFVTSTSTEIFHPLIDLPYVLISIGSCAPRQHGRFGILPSTKDCYANCHLKMGTERVC